MSIIEVKNLKFSYPNSSKLTLDIPAFVLEKGSKVFLFGPSGSGKTTFLETLAGVLQPKSGQVQICGQNLEKLTTAQRDRFRGEHIGYIFQSFNLIPYLNVLENILLPLELNPERKKHLKNNSIHEEAKSLCTELGISELIDKSVTELSVGQQQRVAAARAIIGNPELILADEPTSALDYDHREKFIQLLFDVCSKHQITVLFVSHDRSLQGLFDKSISLGEINLVSNAKGV